MLRVLAFALVAGILVAFLLGAPDRLRVRDLLGYLVALTCLLFGAVTYLAIAYLFAHRQ